MSARPRPFPSDAARAVGLWIVDTITDRVLDRLDEHLDARTRITPAALKPKDAATYIGVSEAHMRKLIAAGHIHAIRSTAHSATGTILVRVVDLDRYLTEAAAA